jgi:hypothetical protein
LSGMEESVGWGAPAVATLPDSRQLRNPTGRSPNSLRTAERIQPPPRRSPRLSAYQMRGLAIELQPPKTKQPRPDRRTSRPTCGAMPNEPAHRHVVTRARNTEAPKR